MARLDDAVRMQRLAEAVVKYSATKKAEWFKDGRWTLPEMVLTDAARQQGLDDRLAEGRLGPAVQAGEASTRSRPNLTGQAQFDRYDIVSAGPDGKFEQQRRRPLDARKRPEGRQLVVGRRCRTACGPQSGPESSWPGRTV